MAKNKLTVTALLITLMLLASGFIILGKNSSVTAAESNGLLQYEWPQFNGDSTFSRFSYGPAPETSDILWQVNFTNLRSYLAAFNGMIFISTEDSIVALNRDTGKTVWSTKIPMSGYWPVAYKLDDTRMMVESSCLETATGNILWTSTDFCADTGNFNSNVYSPEEEMFYIKSGAFVEAWNFSDLSVPPTFVWKTYVPGGGRVGSGVTYGDGKVFPGSFQDLQMAIDAKTGDVLWTTPTKSAMIFFGSYANGIFVRGGTDDNTMYAFDANTGEVIWSYQPETSGYFCSGTAIAYDTVYVPNKDGHIYAFNLTNGELVWKYKGPGTMLFPGMPTVADGKVYVTSGQNAQYGDESGSSEFVCLDAFSGTPYWSLQIEAYAPRESVAVAYGRLYLIPGEVTESVDSTDGCEYDVQGHVWAIGSESLTDSSWSMFRHDAARSSIGQGGPANLSLIWKFTTGGAVMSSPSIADGIVYFGSQDHNIYAINALSGTQIWNFTTLSTIESSPAVANGKVVTGGEDGYVYCLDAYTGAKQWQTFVNSNLPVTYGSAVMLRSSPAIINGKVYIGSLDGHVYALNFSDGSIVWQFQTGGLIKASPTIVDGAVYIPSETPDVGTIFKIDEETGELVWKKEIPYEHQFTGGTDMIGSPTVAAGMVFTPTNLRAYYCLNATNGNIIWNFSNPEANEFIVSSPIYLDGKVFIVDKFDITCLNASTGIKIWNTFTGDEYYVAPSYADNRIYIVTSERNIFIFDATTGEKLDRYILPSASWSSPTPYGGRLYIGSKDWNLYCLGEYNTATVQVTIQIDKSQLQIGDSIVVSGQLSPAISNAEIKLTFSKPDETKEDLSVFTKSDGSFTNTYTPSIEGNWIVTATYQAETTVTSPAQAFKVATTTSTITLPAYVYVLIIAVIVLSILIVAIFVFFKQKEKY